MASRTIPSLDDRDAWAAVCFVIRHGAQVVGGYPIECNGATQVDVISGYGGPTRLFEQAGFVRAGFCQPLQKPAAPTGETGTHQTEISRPLTDPSPGLSIAPKQPDLSAG